MRKMIIFIAIILMIFSVSLIGLFFILKPFYDINIRDNIKVADNSDKIVLNLAVYNDSVFCGHSKNGKKSISWVKPINHVCTLEVSEDLENIYLKKWFFIRKQKIEDLVVTVKIPDKMYLALYEEKKIDPKIIAIGDNTNIVYESSNNDVVSIKDDKLVAKKLGNSKVKIIVNDKYEQETNIVVTDLIVARPKKFDKNKSNLRCNQFDKEEAKILDDILKSKIEAVGGYGTRAAVVESMRFLLLDFPYQIEYFFENGRLDGGTNKADGEGRYYHKGLYLSEDKFKDLKYIYSGPAIWGCPLRNWEDWGTTFKKGRYKPNGLDCSGFVSWAIYNGGYDIGDRGAGDNLQDNSEINDIGGEKVSTSVELFKSGKVKAGDLLGIWGHIAIVAGIDKDRVYVAESLWTYGGPVINTYTFEEATDEFVQAVLLDDLYKKDGLYTNMW